MSAAGNTVEVVRGHRDDALSEEILAFWSGLGLLVGDAARARLQQVVCVLRTDAGELAGVNSAFAEQVPTIGNRTFWVYRSALSPATGDDDYFSMLSDCFEVFAGEFRDSGTGPVGVCLLVEDAALPERHPEAVWPESRFMYAGFLPDGRQVRIRYFEDARI